MQKDTDLLTYSTKMMQQTILGYLLFINSYKDSINKSLLYLLTAESAKDSLCFIELTIRNNMVKTSMEKSN